MPANISAELQALPLGYMLGSPLKAVIEAQALAAKTTVDFIQNVGLEDDGAGGLKVRAADFTFVQPVPDPANPGSFIEQETKLTVPILTIVPVPYIRVSDLNVSFEFVEGEGLLLMLDAQGIAVVAGMSCASKALKVSPVLTAMGIGHTLAQGSILLSPGKDTTDADIDAVLETLPKIVRKLRGMSPSWDEFERGLVDSVIEPRNK